MIVYLDTSALVKLYVAESKSAEVRKMIRKADSVATSRVAYPEARSAFARRHREGALTPAGIRKAVSALDRDMDAYVIVELQEHVARQAGLLAERHSLRGFDAIHLASALDLGLLAGRMPAFVTFDDRQARAADEEGLKAFGASRR
ncbi:MAG: type II toxin-antitoxin system VapC family toxin [Deltaproteobacteria bacterium]|nr:type II toxin-antitoxin system VapC family toxin [Deltaproteobacteria bacterium]